MDLPTCPSCGQSVLDDEPVSCPFCGAAMDGSSGPTKDPAPKKPTSAPPKKKPSSKPAKVAKETDDKDVDPFDIAASPQARRAIACAPKRTKSRPMPVKCPMCDTKGYVPRSAAGKQVKCWNKECMVPLFDAPVPEGARKPSSSAGVSEKAVQQEERLKTPTQARSPVVMYGVIGAVTLVAGLGLKFYLDREPNLDHLNKPISLTPTTVDNVQDEDETEGTTNPKADPEPKAESSVVVIERLAHAIVDSARVSTNRDKALCRRYSGDAFERIGQQERAEKEFAQLLVVSRQRDRNDDYYRILPRSRVYWQAVAVDDQDLATSTFEQIQADASTLPTSGSLAIEGTIQWASVLAHRELLTEAKAAVDRVVVDNTVRAQQDLQQSAVWLALTDSAAEQGQGSVTPMRVLTMQQPVAVAVGVELARHHQLAAAIAWARRWEDALVQTELVSQIARQSVCGRPPDSLGSELTNAVSALSPALQQRVGAIVARRSDEALQTVASEILSAQSSERCPMLSVAEILNYRISDRSDRQLDAKLLADLASSAASRQSVDITAKAIIAVYQRLRKELPNTRSVREASAQLDTSRSDIEAKLREALKRPASADVSNEFRNYRRGLDRLAAATERRRLFLIALLCPVVETDGGAGVAQALQQDEELRDELTLDPLFQLLAAEAILAGGQIPELVAVTETQIAPGERVSLQPEIELAKVWFQLVQGSQETGNTKLFADLDRLYVLPGLRTCLRYRIAESEARRGDLSILAAANEIATEVDREITLRAAALWLTRQGEAEAVEKWVKGNKQLSPSASVLAMAGIISGLPAVETETE